MGRTRKKAPTSRERLRIDRKHKIRGIKIRMSKWHTCMFRLRFKIMINKLWKRN